MNMYELKIATLFGSVHVESADFDYLKDVKEALDSVQDKADKAEKQQMNLLVRSLFDVEVEKTKAPVKKRGRPVGSTSKAIKAK
jgi:hypothetical protein